LVPFSLAAKKMNSPRRAKHSIGKVYEFFTTDRSVAQKGTLVRAMNKLRDLVPRSKLILYVCLQIEQMTMNRRKKGNQILKARVKKAKAKLSPESKSKYISKADREKLATN